MSTTVKELIEDAITKAFVTVNNVFQPKIRELQDRYGVGGMYFRGDGSAYTMTDYTSPAQLLERRKAAFEYAFNSTHGYVEFRQTRMRQEHPTDGIGTSTFNVTISMDDQRLTGESYNLTIIDRSSYDDDTDTISAYITFIANQSNGIRTYRGTYTGTKVGNADATGTCTLDELAPTIFTTTTDRIRFKGTGSTGVTYDMIRFLDNTNDDWGYGISIGGGGPVIIGGGESAATIVADTTNYPQFAGQENMIIANDNGISFFSNVQNGTSGIKKMIYDSSGNLLVNGGGGVFVGANKTAYYTQQGVGLSYNGNITLTGAASGAGAGLYWARTGSNSYVSYIAQDSNNALVVSPSLQCTGNIFAIGAGEHYCEARNTTTGMRALLDSDSGGKAGIWVNGHYSSNNGLTSQANWLIYQGNTAGSGSNVWLSSSGVDVIAHGGLYAYGCMGCLGSGTHYVKAINTNLGYGAYLYASTDVHGVWSDGYGSTSNASWGLYRDTAANGGVWRIHAYSGMATPIGSISADKQRVSYIGCNSATQASMYAQWNVAGSTYKSMYWTVSSSDPRLKENIKPCTTNALELINKLSMYEFDWINDKKHWKAGLIAPEVYEIEPELAIKPDDEEEGYWGIDDFYLTSIQTKAIQELSAENDELKSQIFTLNSRIAQLEAIILKEK